MDEESDESSVTAEEGQPTDTAEERIAALDAMLSAAHARERDLMVELVRHQTRVAEYEAKTSELGQIAARVAAAEDERRRAEAASVEHEQELAVAVADAEAARAEAETLRTRCTELEAELAAVSDQLAEAALARSDAARLEKERNQARARAHTERRLAAEDRIRAAEAEQRAADLQGRLRAAERRILENSNGGGSAKPQVQGRRALLAPDAGAPPRPDVIDLTEAEKEVAEAEAAEGEGRERGAPAERVERQNGVVLEEDNWAAAAPAEESRLHRLLHPRRRR